MASPGSIVYLVLAHADPKHLRRLLARLHGPRARVFVHLDQKADLREFWRDTKDIGPIHYCSGRVKVTWAAFSVVEATLNLLEAALAAEPKSSTDRFVLLSGADYPIATNDEIADYFDRQPAKQFIRGFPVLAASQDQAWRVRGRHLRELAPRHSRLRPFLYTLERAALLLYPRRLPEGLTFVCGSQWWALTRECARYCLGFARAHPEFVNMFKSMFAPDELFFHTIVHNSPYARSADALEEFVDDVIVSGGTRYYANLHYVSQGPIATEADAQAAFAARPSKLFARKFSSEASTPALDWIDRRLFAHAWG